MVIDFLDHVPRLQVFVPEVSVKDTTIALVSESNRSTTLPLQGIKEGEMGRVAGDRILFKGKGVWGLGKLLDVLVTLQIITS